MTKLKGERSKFPNGIDELEEKFEPSTEQMKDIKRYRELVSNNNRSQAQDEELQGLVKAVSPFLLTSEDWNTFGDIVIKTQKHYRDNTVKQLDSFKRDISNVRDGGVSQIQQKSAQAISDIADNKTKALDEIKSQKETSVNQVKSQGESATLAISENKNSAVNAINNIREVAEKAVADSGDFAVSCVNIAKDETINEMNSIEKDYSSQIKGLKEDADRNYSELRGRMDKFKYVGEYDPETLYEPLNLVGADIFTYLCLEECKGIYPETDETKFRKLTLKGDTGYAVGLRFKGDYDFEETYVIDDLVDYNGSLYWVKEEVKGEIPYESDKFVRYLSGSREDLTKLKTENKNSVVGAVNEVFDKAENKLDKTEFESEKNSIDRRIGEKLDEAEYRTNQQALVKSIDRTTSAIDNKIESHIVSNVDEGVHGIRFNRERARIEVYDNGRWIDPTSVAGPYKVYSVMIDQSNPNPETCCTYADDAEGMTPGSNVFDEFFGYYPVMLKDGVEGKRLNPNDFTKYVDYSYYDPDITSGKEGDVMICFPRRGIKLTTVGDVLTVSVTDDPNKEGFSYLAHERGGRPLGRFYFGAYLGSEVDGKIRSLSGKIPLHNVTIGASRDKAQANGKGYEQQCFYQRSFIQALYLLKYKSLDSQTALGYGCVNVDEYPVRVPTGGTDKKGMNFGETTGAQQIKLFGIEDFWGNIWQWLDGLTHNNGFIYTTTDNFTNNYTLMQQGSQYYPGNNYVKTVIGTNAVPFIPKTYGESKVSFKSKASYWCDRMLCGEKDDSPFAVSNGNGHSELMGGVFFLDWDYSASGRYSEVGARLSFFN